MEQAIKSPWISYPLKYLHCLKEWIDVVGLNPKSKLFLFGTVCAGMGEWAKLPRSVYSAVLISTSSAPKQNWQRQIPLNSVVSIPDMGQFTSTGQFNCVQTSKQDYLYSYKNRTEFLF